MECLHKIIFPVFVMFCCCTVPEYLFSENYYVANTAFKTGDRLIEPHFDTITAGLAVSQPGDTVFVMAGAYNESIVFARGGTGEMRRITLKAYASDKVIISYAGRGLEVEVPYITVENLIFDANWTDMDAVKLRAGANYFTMRYCEIKNTRRDGIDITGALGVVIENTKIHDCIWVDGNKRFDAHGIVASGVKNLLILNCEIYYVSGDAVQLQYGGWDDVIIENSTLWNGPLPTARGGAPAGITPGENAIDTKYHVEDGRGRLFIKNTTAFGWRSDYVTNAAAFNIKHNVEVIFDGITTWDNEIAFRLRGPGSKGGAKVLLLNSVIFDSNTGIRYEDAIENLHIYNTTWGRNITNQFQSAGGYGAGFVLQNGLFLLKKPKEAFDSSNIAVRSSDFRNVAENDYRLKSNSKAIDRGISIEIVTTDRAGLGRPQGLRYDVGAYEFR